MSETTNYDDLKDSFEKEDPDRNSMEKETGITFSKPDSRMIVNTAEAGIARRLLVHPEFELDWYETTGENGYRTVTADEYEEEGHDKRKPVYAVSGTLPIAVLSIKRDERQTGGHANVVTGSVLQDND